MFVLSVRNGLFAVTSLLDMNNDIVMGCIRQILGKM